MILRLTRYYFTISTYFMEFSNQKRSKNIVLVGLAFLWLKMDAAVLITAAVFAFYVGVSPFANLCYVYFSTDNGKVLIRYYPVITIIKKQFESIEFAQSMLINFQIEKSMGFEDLTIVIKTKRGIAEYPTISLAALRKDEIEQIRKELGRIIKSQKGK
jgi:hypothetical protein